MECFCTNKLHFRVFTRKLADIVTLLQQKMEWYCLLVEAWTHSAHLASAKSQTQNWFPTL